jgi:hypothetical protein
MKKIAGCGVQAILLAVIAAVIAIPLACLATMTAPLHSPGFASKIICPPGSHVQSEWYQASYDQPGESSLAVTCVDAQGNPVPANPYNVTTLINGIWLYFPVCFIPLIVPGALVLLVLNGLIVAVRRRKANPG